MTEHAPTPGQRPSLEEILQEHFAGVTTAQLIRKMERAPDDANLDDETFELSRRMRQLGKVWRWTRDFENPRIVVGEKAEGEK
ncbi:hypothetical protein HWD35_10450 [Tsukamurella tyrosinosolvens]|uniref:hypothetical protein n=1 Tax=Tsukamurella tyrosinosolvens TaxID=57704 RepID=UPI001CE0D0CD|nr:hypothetical protein [Tsukamurella tyrosinosolvens]MCA4995132.1 hypothetical protein [Tsukamurella tyrosinosolvens]